MRTIVGLWRWRGNPLCRRTDRREAWLSLWAAVLMVLGAPLVGLWTEEATQSALLRAAAEQQGDRQRTWATVLHVTVRPPLDSETETAAGRQQNRNEVTARWAGPDGAPHTGTVVLRRPIRPGDRFSVWTDGRGRLTSRPMSARGAASHSLLAGLAAGAASVAVLEAARRVAVRLVLRRRYALWDEEWGRIGPDWGRAGSSS
ncbi:hypothetical protein ACF1DY_25795 [Streptomyces albus]